MARPRKRINNTPYPDHVIDAVARTFYPKLLEDWQRENILNEFDNNIHKEYAFYDNFQIQSEKYKTKNDNVDDSYRLTKGN